MFCVRRETGNFASDAGSLKESAPWEAELDALYSKYPAGSVGLALLLLRLADGFGLFGEGIHLFTRAGSGESAAALLVGLMLVAGAILLVLGLRTVGVASTAVILAAGVTVYGSRHLTLSGAEIHPWLILFALVFFLSTLLALLGPGGYSLDARLSGWRTIKFSPRQSTSKDAD